MLDADRDATTSTSASSLGGDGTILARAAPLRGHGRAGLRRELRRGRLPGDDRARRRWRARRSRARSRGEFEVLTLPAIVRRRRRTATSTAINDVSIHRKVGERVAELAYAIERRGGRARCAATALVVATPAGSTGYNLANGGPVLAWGVEGFVVSFIAPHSLTARALVVAPERPADGPQPLARRASTSRRRAAGVASSAPGDAVAARSCARRRTSRRCPGSSFYRRLREKFGRLSS